MRIVSADAVAAATPSPAPVDAVAEAFSATRAAFDAAGAPLRADRAVAVEMGPDPAAITRARSAGASLEQRAASLLGA